MSISYKDAGKYYQLFAEKDIVIHNDKISITIKANSLGGLISKGQVTKIDNKSWIGEGSIIEGAKEIKNSYIAKGAKLSGMSKIIDSLVVGDVLIKDVPELSAVIIEGNEINIVDRPKIIGSTFKGNNITVRGGANILYSTFGDNISISGSCHIEGSTLKNGVVVNGVSIIENSHLEDCEVTYDMEIRGIEAKSNSELYTRQNSQLTNNRMVG